MSTTYKFEQRIQKRFSDFDMFRHVNNTVYPQYLETARLYYFKDFLRVDLEKYLGLTVKLEIEYVRAANFEDSCSVLIRTKSIGNSSIDLEYEIVNSDDRAIIYARGEVKQICCDAASGKPVRFPDEVRRVIVREEGMPMDLARIET